MTWSNNERLYNLLPAVYRVRDAAQGEPLRALLSVIESELELIEADIEGLYDNWFIETCAEWLVPYIGDLLGVRNLHTVDSAGIYSLRAYVANTLRYRQRKGTAAVLEQLAHDVTNWPARVVEFFQLLETTQHFNHVRLDNVRTPDLRDANQLELLNTPFDKAAHTGEVRHIYNRRGKYNILNVGLFLWRLQPYFLSRSTPRAVTSPPDGRYTFNPLGLDVPLFNRPQTETTITHIATETNVPTPLRRRAVLKNKLDYLGEQPSFEIYFDGGKLSPEEIIICNLEEWDDSAWSRPASDGTTQVAVDPQVGRLALLAGVSAPANFEVSRTYAFSSDVGGGPYNRRDSWQQRLEREVTWQVAVNQTATPVPDRLFNTLTEAVAAWNAQPPGTVGVIAITDSHTYAEDLVGTGDINIPEHSLLAIVAAQWPNLDNFQLNPDDVCPLIAGNISFQGTAPDSETNAGEVILNGVLIEGTVRIKSGNLRRLSLDHCTLARPDSSLIAPSESNANLEITLDHTICGEIQLAQTVPSLEIFDSIVDNEAGADITAPGANVRIERSTIIGQDDPEDAPTMRSLYASESIFTGRLIVERRQIGCVRFCHVVAGSRVPRRYRCQPDLALDGVDDPAEQRAIQIQLTPLFTSRDYGDPGYGQLSQPCAVEIRTGAEDGSEMGVFSHLKQPQREANLRVALEEYLRFGLEAGIFYVT